MASPGRSNPLALAVLCCLYEAPMHPYEAAQTLRSRAKHESVRLNFGSLYNVVDQLERRGFVRVRETIRDGKRPERTIYEITENGAREMTDWLSELVSSPVKEYLQFEVALSFLPGLPPDDVAAMLTQRVRALELQLVQRRAVMASALAEGLPRLFLLEDEYQACLLDAELEFVRRLTKDIESGELAGIEMWRTFHSPGGLMAHDHHDTPHETEAPHKTDGDVQP
jgi:DNA-binding PadR family transcriptional regulator